MEAGEHSISIPDSTYKALVSLRRNGQHDADIVQSAVSLLDAHSVLVAGISQATSSEDPCVGLRELSKASIAVQQMREAGYSEEKVTAVCRALFVDQSNDNMGEAFKFFDADGRGYIDRMELRKALPLMGEQVSEAAVDQLFAAVDADKSDQVDVAEFTRLVRGMNPKPGYSDDAFLGLDLALKDGAGKVGHALQEWTANLASGASAFGAAWQADLKGLGPLELRKAGAVINNMKAAGYSEEMANKVCRALFCEQSEADLKEAFAVYDKNGSGCIDKEEFKQALPLMGEEVPPEMVDKVMEGVDENKTGKLEFPEFCELVRRMNPKPPPEEASSDSGDPLKEAWGKVTAGWGAIVGGGDKESSGQAAAGSAPAEPGAGSAAGDAAADGGAARGPWGWFAPQSESSAPHADAAEKGGGFLGFQWPGQEKASGADSGGGTEAGWGWPWPQQQPQDADQSAQAASSSSDAAAAAGSAEAPSAAPASAAEPPSAAAVAAAEAPSASAAAEAAPAGAAEPPSGAAVAGAEAPAASAASEAPDATAPAAAESSAAPAATAERSEVEAEATAAAAAGGPAEAAAPTDSGAKAAESAAA